jgi:anti-sigma-K factor RskA
MMDKKKIIEDGLMASYILGDLDPSIQKEVEKAIQNDEALQTLYKELEEDFEQLGMDNAVSPPAGIKAELMQKISTDAGGSEVLSLNNKYKTWFSMAAAASVILFLNTIFLIVQNGDIKQQLASLQSESEQLKEAQESLRASYNNQGEMLAFLSHPETEQYMLQGNEQQPEAKLVSYVNHSNKTVMVNTSQMTALDDAHDYQMWADVEGEMIDMGVINLEKPLLAMNYIEQAESFNITIEPKGGSEHPTVSNLISNTYLR